MNRKIGEYFLEKAVFLKIDLKKLLKLVGIFWYNKNNFCVNHIFVYFVEQSVFLKIDLKNFLMLVGIFWYNKYSFSVNHTVVIELKCNFSYYFSSQER